MVGASRITLSNEPARNQLCISANRRPSPSISSAFRFSFDATILFFRSDKAPNLITLDALAFQIHESLVLIIRASSTEITEKFYDSVFRNACHSNSCANGVSLDKAGNNLLLFVGFQFVHAFNNM